MARLCDTANGSWVNIRVYRDNPKPETPFWLNGLAAEYVLDVHFNRF